MTHGVQNQKQDVRVPGLGWVALGRGIGGESESGDLSSCFFKDQRSDNLS